MSQGSILHAQNQNTRLGAKPAKNRKFLHIAQKSVNGPRIMQGLILYAYNYSKLSRDTLKPCLLKKIATSAICIGMILRMEICFKM